MKISDKNGISSFFKIYEETKRLQHIFITVEERMTSQQKRVENLKKQLGLMQEIKPKKKKKTKNLCFFDSIKNRFFLWLFFERYRIHQN